MTTLVSLVPSFSLFGFTAVWFTHSLWFAIAFPTTTVSRASVRVSVLTGQSQWFLVLAVPFFDGTVETLDQIRLLFLPLAFGALSGLLISWMCSLPLLVYVDLWRMERSAPGDSSKEPRWVFDGCAGIFIGAFVAVLAYGFAQGYLTPDAPTRVGVLFAVLAGLLAAFCILYSLGRSFVHASPGMRLTARNLIVMLILASAVPLAYRLPPPWNIVLAEVLLFVVCLITAIVSVSWQAALRKRDDYDVRITASESRFARQFTRWFIFALFNGAVYLVAFLLTENDNFTLVMGWVIATQLLASAAVCTWALATAPARTQQPQMLPVVKEDNPPSPQMESHAGSIADPLDAFNLNKPNKKPRN